MSAQGVEYFGEPAVRMEKLPLLPGRTTSQPPRYRVWCPLCGKSRVVASYPGKLRAHPNCRTCAEARKHKTTLAKCPAPEAPRKSPRRFRAPGATMHNPRMRVRNAEVAARDAGPSRDVQQPWEGRPDLLPKRPPGGRP